MRFLLIIISQVLGEAPHDMNAIYGRVFVHANFFSYILKQIKQSAVLVQDLQYVLFSFTKERPSSELLLGSGHSSSTMADL